MTAEWLKKAPGSAYANLARGAFYHGSAWKARGGKFSSETADENLRRMTGFVEQAIPYYENAISINPRLIPAYTALINLGMLDSGPDPRGTGRWTWRGEIRSGLHRTGPGPV